MLIEESKQCHLINFKIILIFLQNFIYIIDIYKIIIYYSNKFLNKYDKYEK